VKRWIDCAVKDVLIVINYDFNDLWFDVDSKLFSCCKNESHS